MLKLKKYLPAIVIVALALILKAAAAQTPSFAQLIFFRLAMWAVVLYGIHRLIKHFVPHGKKKWAWLGLVFAIIAFFYVQVSDVWNKSGYGLVGTGYTNSMEPVDVMLDGEVRMRIPKAYLANKRNWTGGNQELVNIEAVLPDLTPRSLAPYDSIKERDIVYIDLLSGLKVLPSQSLASKEYEIVKKYLISSSYGVSKVDEKIFEDKKNNLVHGIHYFSHNDYYFLTEGIGRNARIQCEKGEGGNCQAYTTFGGKISGSYSASEYLLPKQWKDVDDKVVKLINSFIITESGER